MGSDWGELPLGTVVPFIFTSHDATTGANEAMSGLALADIEVYKGVSLTQRSSDVGYAFFGGDADGIDLDTFTGVNGVSIDTGDNTDAGFFVAGSLYTVVLGPITVDAQTIYTVLGTFRLIAAEAVAGVKDVNVTHWIDTAAATPTVAGVPEVDVTYWGGVGLGDTNIAKYFAIGVLTGQADSGTTTTMVDAALTTADTDYYKGSTITFLTGTLIYQSRRITGFTPATDTITFAPALTQAVGTHVYMITPAGTVDLAAINGVAQTATLDDIEAQTDDIGAAGAGLTAIPTIATVTTLTNLPSITANWLTAAGIAAAALNGKGDWNIGKTGYTLSAAGVAAIWDALTTGMTTAGSIGKKLTDWVVGTIDTYTGNTKQTGDNFARLGAPAGASVSADIAAAKVDTAAILVDTGTTLDGRIPAALVGGKIDAVADVTAISGDATAADNLEKEYDGTGYGHILQRTTIATLASQVSFTLTAGSADNDAYNGCIIVIEDATTAAQKAVGVVGDYTGATKTVTMLNDPAIFTMAATDIVTIIADRALKATVDNRNLDVSAGGEAGLDWANIGSPTTAQNLSATNIDVDQVVASVSGAVASVTGLTPATVHSDLDDIQARLPAALSAGGNMKSDVLSLGGVTQSLTDLKDFADDGYDPATNKVQGVVLTDTVTTYTGDTPQTGDSFARIGATGSGLTTLATQASVNTIDDFLDTEIQTIITMLTGIVPINGTIGATGNSTTVLHLAGLAWADDGPNSMLLLIKDVSAGIYVSRWIEDFANAGDLATVATLPFTPEASVDTYWILPVRSDVTGGSGLDAAGVRAALGFASANFDTQIGDLPTNAELATSQGTADDATLAAIAGIWTTALTESYNADGVAPTPAQALFVLLQMLTEMTISGTTMTIKKLDGTTTALTLTLNDASSPTSVTRAT